MLRTLLFRIAVATGLLAGATVFSASAQAALTYTGVCPSTFGHVPEGGAGTGNAVDCNLLIIFNADGSIVTQAGLQTTYESVEDALMGVVNNSGHTITSFNLTGNALAYGFEDRKST